MFSEVFIYAFSFTGFSAHLFLWKKKLLISCSHCYNDAYICNYLQITYLWNNIVASDLSLLIFSSVQMIIFLSSLNVFDDGVVLLRSILWTSSIVSMFYKHNVSRDGSSLETLWLQNTETMDKVQRIDRNNNFSLFLCFHIFNLTDNYFPFNLTFCVLCSYSC
jgi:hypothetical protein